MPKFFETLDRVRPVYDWVYKIIMFGSCGSLDRTTTHASCCWLRIS